MNTHYKPIDIEGIPNRVNMVFKTSNYNEAAKRLKVSTAYPKLLTQGKGRLTPSLLNKLSNTFAVYLPWLLQEEHSPYPTKFHTSLKSCICNDDAMAPIIEKGALVFYEPMNKNEDVTNDIYVIELLGNTVIRKIEVLKKNELYRLKSTNTNYQDTSVTPSQIILLGKVQSRTQCIKTIQI